MQTELGFLIELLLEHKLPASAKASIAVRVKDVEHGIHTAVPSIPQMARLQTVAKRPPPTPEEAMAMAAEHEARAAGRAAVPTPQPVVVHGITDAAAAAIRQRNELIAAASKGTGKSGPAVGRGHGQK